MCMSADRKIEKERKGEKEGDFKGLLHVILGDGKSEISRVGL